jgi:hypothetical protein
MDSGYRRDLYQDREPNMTNGRPIIAILSQTAVAWARSGEPSSRTRSHTTGEGMRDINALGVALGYHSRDYVDLRYV